MSSFCSYKSGKETKILVRSKETHVKPVCAENQLKFCNVLNLRHENGCLNWTTKNGLCDESQVIAVDLALICSLLDETLRK